MSETKTATAKTKAATRQAADYQGKRVVVWNPEADYRLGDQAPLKGYEMVRQYVFCYVDAVATAKAKETAKRTLAHDKLVALGDDVPHQPVFKELILTPGLNWIEAQAWDKATHVSAERYQAEIEDNNPKAVDEINRLLQSRAILVFEPNERVQETRQFTGNFEDYDAQELKRLMAQVDDIGALQQYAKDTNDYALTQVIQERINALNTGY